MLITIPDILDNAQVAEARRILDAAEWVDGKVTAGFQSAQAKGYQYVTDAAGLSGIKSASKPVLGLINPSNMSLEWTGPAASLGKGNAPRSITDPAAAIAALDDRKRDLHWDDLEFIKKESGLPLIVKGVLSAPAT